MTEFVIATNNEKKLFEINRILRPLSICAVTAKEKGIELGEVEENGSTFAENAYIKAINAASKCDCAVIADDSGLCVDALDGRPGIYSARYGGESSSNDKKIQMLLDELKNVEEEKRGAHFTCSICCILKNGRIIKVEDYCYGSIAYEPFGNGGFGYDPIFLVNGKSFASLSDEEKDALSHRGNALRKLKEELSKYTEEF